METYVDTDSGRVIGILSEEERGAARARQLQEGRSFRDTLADQDPDEADTPPPGWFGNL